MAVQSSARARLAVAKFLGTPTTLTKNENANGNKVDSTQASFQSQSQSGVTGKAQAVAVERSSRNPTARGGVGLSEEHLAQYMKEKERSALEKLAASSRKGGNPYSQARRGLSRSSSEDESDDDAAESRTQSAKRSRNKKEDAGASPGGTVSKKTVKACHSAERHGPGAIREGEEEHEMQHQNEKSSYPTASHAVPEVDGREARMSRDGNVGRENPRRKKKTRSRQKNLRRDTRSEHEKPAHLTEETMKQPRLARHMPQ